MSTNTTYALAVLPHKSQPHLKVINLRVTTNRKPKYKSLGINIQSKNWNKRTQRVYAGEPNANFINQQIEKALLEAQVEKTTFEQKSEKTFLYQATKIIEGTHTPSTKTFRYVALQKLENYLEHMGELDITCAQVNNLFIDRYYTWLLTEGRIKTSSANEYMQILSQVINKLHKGGIHNYNIHPFVNYKRKKTSIEIEVLDDSELKLLIDYTPRTKKQKIAHSTFFFMMHLSGIRISDALRLTFSNFFVDKNGHLMVRYTTQKNSRQMHTRVSMEAILYLTNFLVEFDDTVLSKIKDLYKNYLIYKNRYTQYEKEFYQIRIKNSLEILNEVKKGGKVEGILEEQAELERQRNKLSNQNRHDLLQLGHIEQYIINLGKELLMKLKKNHSNTPVLPHMRGIYYGETKLTKKLTKQMHSAKTSNNSLLNTMGKKLGIEKRISNHQARHIFAMKLFLAGHNIHHISLALGHSSLQVTENYRRKLIDDSTHDITSKFSETVRNL